MGPSNRLTGLGGLGNVAPRPKLGPPLPLGLLSETPEQAAQRKDEVVTLVFDAFHVAVNHLGEKDARMVWHEVAKAKPGRRKGTRDVERDRKLLNVYDAVAPTVSEAARKALPRQIAMFAKEQDPQTYRAVVASIEMHLRRLLKRRAEQARVSNALYAQFLMRAPPGFGLLGNLVADAKATPDPTPQGETKNPGD